MRGRLESAAPREWFRSADQAARGALDQRDVLGHFAQRNHFARFGAADHHQREFAAVRRNGVERLRRQSAQFLRQRAARRVERLNRLAGFFATQTALGSPSRCAWVSAAAYSVSRVLS